MDQVHFERNVYQSQCLNIGDHDIVYGNTQMCDYCDASWVDNMDGHKSTLGHFYLLGKFNGAISYNSKKQPLLLCHRQKLNVWQLHKQQNKQCGFHQFLGALTFNI